jgi:hypothetical protein
MLPMTSWQPEIGDEVRVILRKRDYRPVYGPLGKIVDISEGYNLNTMQMSGWVDRYRVRYRAPWGWSSGWYTREQIERVK